MSAPESDQQLLTILVLGLVAIGIVAAIGLIWLVIANIRERMAVRRAAAAFRKAQAAQDEYRAQRIGVWTPDTFDENAPVGTAGGQEDPPPGGGS
jgi:type II secretory pathway pseudopilin PulG